MGRGGPKGNKIDYKVQQVGGLQNVLMYRLKSAMDI